MYLEDILAIAMPVAVAMLIGSLAVAALAFKFRAAPPDAAARRKHPPSSCGAGWPDGRIQRSRIQRSRIQSHRPDLPGSGASWLADPGQRPRRRRSRCQPMSSPIGSASRMRHLGSPSPIESPHPPGSVPYPPIRHIPLRNHWPVVPPQGRPSLPGRARPASLASVSFVTRPSRSLSWASPAWS